MLILAAVTAPLPILAVLTAPFLIFPSATASFASLPVTIALPLISSVPILVAAKAVAPPRTKNTAIDDITFAYVSRLRTWFT